MTCFVDTNMNYFREKVLVLNKDKFKSPIALEVDAKSENGDL